MNSYKFNINDIAIQTACEIDSILLNDFFINAFPHRPNSQDLYWKWRNRSYFLENKTPLILVYEKKVIAYLGMMPFYMSINGVVKTTTWLFDFKVLPAFQRYGLGSILIKESMKIADCFVGVSANEKSIGILTKFGWFESNNSYMHLNLIQPFNYPRFVGKMPILLRKLLNYLSLPVLFSIYSQHCYSKHYYKLVQLNEISFKEFFSSYTAHKKNLENTISPIRDIDYANWRILNSPNKDNYFIYKTEKFSAVLLLDTTHFKHIDILWVANNCDKQQLVKMISSLGIFGLKNGFSYIRFYTTNKDLSVYIRHKTKSIVRHPRLAYYSKNNDITKILHNSIWNFELIDSDLENVYSFI